MSDSTSQTKLVYQRTALENLVDQALSHARKVGATDAAASVSESLGLGLSVRNGELENIEHHRGKSLGITVYLNQQTGHATTSDFSALAIEQTVQAAFDIARFTAPDDAAGLPDAQALATSHADFDLFHPWHELTQEKALQLAKATEHAACSLSPEIRNSEGATVSSYLSQFFSAHTHGFRGGFASSQHSLSVSVIAGSGENMQRDGWYNTSCYAPNLASPETIGRYAAERALAHMGAHKIPTTQCPVLFDAPLATGLISAYVQATSGGALYRKNTFLLDSLGKTIFPSHITLEDDPTLKRQPGSASFDAEGVQTQKRNMVEAGAVQSYFLGTYSARKLGMQSTGHGGGAHNLRLYSSQTQERDDLSAMIRKLGRGLFVTELLGYGVNAVTGDYSRGARGFWVENGELAFPVQEITIAGNLKSMFASIVHIGADRYTSGSKTTGSILIEAMKVAGS